MKQNRTLLLTLFTLISCGGGGGGSSSNGYNNFTYKSGNGGSGTILIKY